jgi:hypothetical protein
MPIAPSNISPRNSTLIASTNMNPKLFPTLLSPTTSDESLTSCPPPSATIIESRHKGTKEQASLAPTFCPLSAKSLASYASNSNYVFKEFPHLKDYSLPTLLPLHNHNDVVASTSTVSEAAIAHEEVICPFSPLASDLDCLEFDWDKDVFDSHTIRMYLQC